MENGREIRSAIGRASIGECTEVFAPKWAKIAEVLPLAPRQLELTADKRRQRSSHLRLRTRGFLLDGSKVLGRRLPPELLEVTGNRAGFTALVGPDHGNTLGAQVCLANTLQAGTSLVASGYCLFSSSCVFVLTLGAGTHGFTLNREVGEFVLTHPDIHIPTRGKISSFNQV